MTELVPSAQRPHGFPPLCSGEPSPSRKTSIVSIYNYYLEGGSRRILLRNLSNLIRILFLVITTFIFSFCLNWPQILSCKDEQCGHSSLFVRPFSKMSGWLVPLVILQVTFCVYFLLETLKSIGKIRESQLSKLVFRQIELKDSEIKQIPWETVTSRLRECGLTQMSDRQISGQILKVENLLQGGPFPRPIE